MEKVTGTERKGQYAYNTEVMTMEKAINLTKVEKAADLKKVKKTGFAERFFGKPAAPKGKEDAGKFIPPKVEDLGAQGKITAMRLAEKKAEREKYQRILNYNDPEVDNQAIAAKIHELDLVISVMEIPAGA